MKQVAVLGATGIIGQQFIRMLCDNPKFHLNSVYASERSAGKKLTEIWNLPFYKCPEEFADIEIEHINNPSDSLDIVFSGLPATVAKEVEPLFRDKGLGVFSNASAFRMDPLIPILIPEINQSHLELVKLQQENTGSQGFIVTNANCSVSGAAIYLGELRKLLAFSHAVITTYQALSGAGIKGVSSIEIASNVIPFIQSEEEKIVVELRKILAKLGENGKLEAPDFRVATNCARVPVIDGHLEAISVIAENEDFNTYDLSMNFAKIRSPLDHDLHFAPTQHLIAVQGNNRPQPRLDAFFGETPATKGMSVIAGRFRKFDDMFNSYILVHNTIRGGAGGSLLNAELMLDRGLI